MLRYEDVPDPQPGAGEAVVDVAAAGVNFIDTYLRTGLYPADPPFINGMEAAGTVSAVGEGVTELKAGDRVAFAGVRGAYAEKALAPADRLVKIPDAIEPKTAAAAMLQGMTVHYLTHSTFPLEPGHTALVHAAAGGVGLILVQVAKMRGARVIATCSTEEKAKLVREAGADEVILYTEQDFLEEVKRLTDGRGVDVAYDSVGKATWERSMNCLRPRGLLVLYGNASGPVPPIDPLMLSQKGSLFVTRPTLAHHVAAREELLQRAGDLFSWIQEGKVKIRIGETFPLSEAAEAHRRLEGRQTAGKVLLIP